MHLTDPNVDIPEYWYRAYEIWSGASMHISFMEYRVIKHTPCGVILDDWDDSRVNGKGRFVSRRVNKAFARDNKQDALNDYIHRKRRQIPILNNRLKWAKVGRAAAQEFMDNEETDFDKLRNISRPMEFITMEELKTKGA